MDCARVGGDEGDGAGGGVIFDIIWVNRKDAKDAKA
jgi:hypothetical protein